MLNLAQAAEDSLSVLRISKEAQEYKDAGIICDLNEGNAPYKGRYDPTTPGTDHSREYVPLLLYGKNIKAGIDLGVRKTFADIASTVMEIFGLDNCFPGKSFKELFEIKEKEG